MKSANVFAISALAGSSLLASFAFAAPFEASKSLSARQLAEAQWEQQIQKRAQQVASTYPVDYRSNVSDYSLFEVFQNQGELPQPIRGKTGSTNIGPDDVEILRQNPDSFAPPSTDMGTIPQAKWPFALSHNRLQNGGWARQQNVDVLPVATEIAGVNMRLEQGAFREMHWHSAAEWAYVLNGTTRVSAVDPQGKPYVADVEAGNLWYFPAGTPHSLQGIGENGTEFLLVFDDGSFSEDSTLLLTDWMAHIPREVIAKNFGEADLSTSAYDNFPSKQLYIFPGEADNSTSGTTAPASPQGQRTDKPFTYDLNSQNATQFNGGSAKIVDSSKFAVSTTIAAALVTIKPGAMRELHWHPNSPEWDYFMSGHARITIFAGQSNARTYDFQGGDTAYIEEQNGHYIENIGNEDVVYLEIFKTPTYMDVSLSNWLALTPPKVVQAHLGFSDDDMNKLYNTFKSKTHTVVTQPGGPNAGNGYPVFPPNSTDSSTYSMQKRSVGGKISFY